MTIHEATSFRGLASRSHASMNNLLQERRVEQGSELLTEQSSCNLKASQSAKDLRDLIQNALDVFDDSPLLEPMDGDDLAASSPFSSPPSPPTPSPSSSSPPPPPPPSPAHPEEDP